MDEIKKDAAREHGRIGGKTRADRLSPEARAESARKAAKARWGKTESDHVSRILKDLKRSAAVLENLDILLADRHLEGAANHPPQSDCPCDRCIGIVLSRVSQRYIGLLKKIDEEEPLDEADRLFYFFMIGSLPDANTRLFRKRASTLEQIEAIVEKRSSS